MGTLTLTSFVTLDGVYQAPGGPKEDPRGGFEHGGWSVPYGDEDFGRFMVEVFERVDAFLLGRRTYNIFASYWPKVTDPADPIASRLNALPKYVASASLKDPEWANTTVLSGDLGKEAVEGHRANVSRPRALGGAAWRHWGLSARGVRGRPAAPRGFHLACTLIRRRPASIGGAAAKVASAACPCCKASGDETVER